MTYNRTPGFLFSVSDCTQSTSMNGTKGVVLYRILFDMALSVRLSTGFLQHPH